jgi:NAD(P)-dependent dehydrogenase (short-subunit alcohol dehydrogenase family)
VVTGGNSGLGFELIKMLYPTGATIYMACRSQTRAEEAIRQITTTESQDNHQAASRLRYLHLDLNDLTTIKTSAAQLIASETRLDILWNNAGIGGAPVGTSTQQNIEGHLGVNCIAPLLFVQELLPLLRETAAGAPEGSVRVVWASSLSMEVFSPRGGIDFNLIDSGATQDPVRDYAM